jgi:hypothetical protein
MSTPESPWTENSLIEALRAWTAMYGNPPTSSQWQASKADSRFRQHAWPSSSVVIQVFGSWNKGIEAAGLSARPRFGWDYEKPKKYRR